MRTDGVAAETARAAKVFLDRIAKRYAVSEAILFGSRARRTRREDSDADIAVAIRGKHGKRSTVTLDMAGVAFEVLLSTGVLIDDVAKQVFNDTAKALTQP